MSATVPPEIASALAAGSPPPADLLPDERRAWDQLDFFYKKGLGYANEMALRPQTLYGIEDSPIGLAAWMIDHDAASQALIGRIFAGESAGLTKDDIIDNVSFYWFSRHGDLVGAAVLGQQPGAQRRLLRRPGHRSCPCQ